MEGFYEFIVDANASIAAAQAVFDEAERKWDNPELTAEQAEAAEAEADAAHDTLKAAKRELQAVIDMVKGFYAYNQSTAKMQEIVKKTAEEAKDAKCPNCLKIIEGGDLSISPCGHFYCGHCLLVLSNPINNKGSKTWQCSICRVKHNYF